MTQSISAFPVSPVAETMNMSRDVVLGLLNAALSTELVSLGRSKKHYFAAETAANDELRAELLEQVIEESVHTDRIVERILELGGVPDFGAQSISEYAIDTSKRIDIRDLILEDLEAQYSLIEHYRNVVRLIGSSDKVTSSVFEEIIRRDQRFVERLAQHLSTLPLSRTATHS